MLKLEILCGSTGVAEDHPGFFSEEDTQEDFCGPVHPKHISIRDRLSSMGIVVEIQNSFQEGLWYSDAYIYFEPNQIQVVADTLRSEDFEGHYLDTPDGYDDPEVIRVAEENFWEIV